MKNKHISILPHLLVPALVGLLVVGCGTLELKGQVLYAEDATATRIAAIYNAKEATSTPVLRNLSPANLPTSPSCQVSFFWGEMPGLCPSMLPTQVDGAFQ